MENKILTELPIITENRNKGKIDWKYTIGMFVELIYQNKKYIIKIEDYTSKKQMLKISYNNEYFNLNTGAFLKIAFGSILDIYSKKYKYNIGDNVFTNSGYVKILEKYRVKTGKKSTHKAYKVKCENCNYCYEVLESNLTKNRGCGCCYNRIVVEGVNSIVDTTPWMIKYFQGGYDEAKMYTCQSNKKIKPICPDCNRVKSKEMQISTIYNEKSIGCSCSDGISYPEKFFICLMEQLNINFSYQITKANFDWCENYRYDFYFELNDKFILETNGSQHPNTKYYNRNGFKTYESNNKDELQNDINKKNNAMTNGNIKEENYIVIDCSLSNMDFIKNEILNSKLFKLNNLNNLDWNKCEEFALSNRVKETCEYKRNNPDMTTVEIGKIMKIHYSTIIDYLKKGTELGWCEYDAKEEMRKNIKNNLKKKNKKIKVIKDGITLAIFESHKDLEYNSNEKLGVKLLRVGVWKSIKHNKPYKGFKFVI